MGDKFGKQKILIICEDNKDVITLKEKIEKREKCKPIFAHDGLEPEDVKGMFNFCEYLDLVLRIKIIF